MLFKYLFALLLLPVAACQKQAPVVNLEQEEGEASAAQISFAALVTRCNMEFALPPGFRFAPGQATDGLDYEATLVAENGGLEVRIALRCLADAEVDYQDPHSSKPAPEHIYPLLYTAIVQQIASDPYSASGGFGENSLGEFHADWGQMSLLQPKPEFGGAYQAMLFLAIHRRAAADAYMVFLFDDYAAVKDQIQTAMASLHFVEMANDSTAPDPAAPDASAEINARENRIDTQATAIPMH